MDSDVNTCFAHILESSSCSKSGVNKIRLIYTGKAELSLSNTIYKVLVVVDVTV